MRHLILLAVFLCILVHPVFAITDPLSASNNRYGIHLADPNDVAEAAKLINSSNGDWGYVTIVIPESDRNTDKWQHIFNEMRRLHVIPIVRLATHTEQDYWVKPTIDSVKEWPAFLNSLNWPVKNRYVALFNEPNHAKEWGNSIDPEGYAAIFSSLAQILRNASEDYFILPAALDVSAQNDGLAMDAAVYWKRMIAVNKDVFALANGWNSHSYPNPGFSGSPYAAGRGSVRTYEWELQYLKQLGVTQAFPIFITETGWEHSGGKLTERKLNSPETVSSYIQAASVGAWANPSIVAITPFVFNYQDYPFDHFSMRKLGGNDYYVHYEAYKNIPKIAGAPEQVEKLDALLMSIPKELVVRSSYDLSIPLKNSGQTIISSPQTTLELHAPEGFYLQNIKIQTIEPSTTGNISFTMQTPQSAGIYEVELILKTPKSQQSLQKISIKVDPPPTLIIRLIMQAFSTGSIKQAKVLLYDSSERIIQRFEHIPVLRSTITLTNVDGVIIGSTYRAVVMVPGFLPRQTYVRFSKGINEITMKRLLPLDPDNDGSFTYKDIMVILQTSPWQKIAQFL